MMVDGQEDFNSLDVIISALQNQCPSPLQFQLQDLKTIYLSSDLQQLLKINESQPTITVNVGQLYFLYFQLANSYELFQPFSIWCLKNGVAPIKNSLLKWVMLIIFTMKYDKNVKSLPAHHKASEINIISNVQNLEVASQIASQKEYSMSSDPEIKSSSFENNANQLQQSQLKRQFVQHQQNENYYELLIQALKNTHSSQLFVWCELIFKINQKNQKNCLKLAFLYFQKKEFQSALRILTIIPKNSALRSQATQLRALCQKQLGNFSQAILYMKQTLVQGLISQHSLQQLSKMCARSHRYLEAAYFLQLHISNDRSNMDMRIQHATCIFYGDMHQSALQLLQEINRFSQILNSRQKSRIYALLGHLNREKRSSIQITTDFYNKALKEYYDSDSDQNEEFCINQNIKTNHQRNYISLIEYFKGVAYFNNNFGRINSKYFSEIVQKSPRFLQPYIYIVRVNVNADNQIIFDTLDKIIDLLPSTEATLGLIRQLQAMLADIKNANIYRWIQTFNLEDIDPIRDSNDYSIVLAVRTADEKMAFIKSWIALQAENIMEQLLHSVTYFFQIQQYQVALLILQRMKAIKQNSQIVYLLTGKCYLKMKQFDKAQKQFDRKFKQNTHQLISLKGLLQICQVKTIQKQMFNYYERLASCYQKLESQSIKENLQEYIYHRKFGRLYLKSKNVQAASNCIIKSLKKLPADETCCQLITTLQFKQNFPKQAKAILQAIQQQQDSKLSVYVICIYLLLGENQKCKKRLELFTTENGLSKRQSQFISITKILFQQDLRKSSKLLSDRLIFVKYFIKDLKAQQFNEAIEKYQLTLHLLITKSIAYLAAELLFNNNMHTQAIYFYEIFYDFQQSGKMDLAKVESSNILKLITMYKKTNSSSKLQELLKQILAVKPKNITYLSQMIDLQCQKKNLQATKEYLNRMLEIQPFKACQKIKALSQSYFHVDKSQMVMRNKFISQHNQTNLTILTLFHIYFEFKDHALNSFRGLLNSFTTNYKTNKSKLTQQIFKLSAGLKCIERQRSSDLLVKTFRVLAAQFSKNKSSATQGIVEALSSFQNLQSYLQKRRFQELAK